MYLGTQLGDERSISHVANKFMGTGMMGPEPAAPEPEPTAPAMADPPGATAAGAGAGAPTPGFMKAARTPPLSTAAAIIEPTLKLDWDGSGPQLSCTRSGRLSAPAHLSHTQICDGSEEELRFKRKCGADAICGRPIGGAESRVPFADRVEQFEAAVKLILTFNRLVPIQVHYKENNPGMFSSKTLISFRLKKDMDILDDMGKECQLKKLDMLKDQHVLLRERKMSNVLWRAGQGALEISAAEESV
ncbi:hypothetical protein DPX16_14667 [Anabarilius grahami]|uniref:Uncharacterized protein n=1 Tax=Anabarilius grahami TaxID=495550 RepID=A0A3N0XNV9_ANAGA|nr:hypothetical protein DPX16_14667 [Anabarilius grahami]